MQQDVPKEEIMYKTKLIQFLGRTTPIILQNENGPCPLIAICNVLLLRNNLDLNPNCDEVSEKKLLSLVLDRVLIDSNSKVNNKDEGYIENQQQNIADAIDLLPRLTTGIDVNIKFRRIDDFEFTPECAIFDLLDIPLYHGWIVDPQDVQAANAIGSKSYNAIMADPSLLETRQYGHARGEIVKNFMKNSASQLTIFGLIRLHEDLKERELCIFFRNNHFCTMFKYEGELYLLATDKGYLNYPDLVWEKLNEVNGDTAYVTATFTNFKVDNGTSGASNTWTDSLANNNNVSDTGREVNSDLQLAITMQEEEYNNQTLQPTSVGASPMVTGPQDYLTITNNVSDTGIEDNCDLQLAITMQEEEYNKQPTSVGAPPQVPRNSHRTSSSAAPLGRKASKCKLM